MAAARVALYEFEADSLDEVREKVQSGMVPILRGQPGFVSYDVVHAGNRLISVSRWESEEQAEQSVQTIADWVRESGVDELVTRTDNYVGEVIVSA
jgi:heme-degrading monooxygenase HmoA